MFICVEESERAVSREEGLALAEELGSVFLECSAKTRENVEKCFQELALKVRALILLINLLLIIMCFSWTILIDEYNLKLMGVSFWIDNQIMEVPSLMEEGSSAVKRNVLKPKQETQPSDNPACCSWLNIYLLVYLYLIKLVLLA